MHTRHLSIDVEQEFAQVIRALGGDVLEDEYGTKLPFKNSDYYFPEMGVAAELKRLVLDQESDPKVQEKVNEKFNRWMEDGTIGRYYGFQKVDSRILPSHCQVELLDCFSGPLRRRMHKGNKQLKQTLDHFKPPQRKGLLFIVNDGNTSITPDMARFLITRILGREFSQVNSVVYFTANLFATSSLTDKDVLVWMHLSRKAVNEPVDADFVMTIFDKWRAHVEALRGVQVERIVADSINLGDMKNKTSI